MKVVQTAMEAAEAVLEDARQRCDVETAMEAVETGVDSVELVETAMEAVEIPVEAEVDVV